MKVELEKAFPMPADATGTWAFLQNVEAVAGCMPGAKITERIDDRHYKGTVAVKVGPASMAFKGDIEVRELDAASRTLRLIGKGADSSGTSGASMDLTARVEDGETPGTSTLIGKSEVSMSGKAAAFGGRMMGTVADQILKQFAANFANEIRARNTSATDAAAPPNAAPIPAQPSTAERNPAPAAESPASSTAGELNALALFWAILRDWARGLFKRKPA